MASPSERLEAISDLITSLEYFINVDTSCHVRENIDNFVFPAKTLLEDVIPNIEIQELSYAWKRLLEESDKDVPDSVEVERRAREMLDVANQIKSAIQADMIEPTVRANEQLVRARLFPQGPPEDSDIVDLVLRLDSGRGGELTMNEIARKFTGESAGNDSKAMKLLARIRKMKLKGLINL